MPFTLDSIPDLTGRTAVVTGGNRGLGFQTARALAAKGARVVLAARDAETTESAAAQLRRETPHAELDLVHLDLSSQRNVRQAAERILGSHDRIDILVNNAGVMATPERPTADGYEMQFGVNHLGHWTLTASLMPALQAAPAGRVVTVTSMARLAGPRVDPANPHLRGRYDPWRAYGQSKLANYHFALGLQREFERAGARAMSLLAHPGLSHTELQATAVASGGAGRQGPFWAWLAEHAGTAVAEGAIPQIRAATDPHAKGGDLYVPRYLTRGPTVRRRALRPGRAAAVRTLWEVSERETGVRLVVAPVA